MGVDEKYMDEHYSGLSPDRKKQLMEVMQKYGNDHWWESTDPVYAAQHQIFENDLLINIDLFTEGLSKITGRQIQAGELRSTKYNDRIKEEVRNWLKRQESKKGLDSRLSILLIPVGFLVSIFFLSPNLTGNIVMGTAKTSSNFIGIGFFVLGLIGVYLWRKQKTK